MKIQSKLVNPTNSTQSVTKDSGYDYLGSVVVNPVKVKQIEIDGSTNDFVIDHTIYRTSLDGYSKINLKAVRMDDANVDSSSNDQVITSETGEGIKEVKVNKLKRETKTAYPTTDTQIFIPSGGKDAFSSFTLEKISSKTDESLIPENIKNGVNILGVTGIAKDSVDHGNKTVDASTAVTYVRPISLYDYYSTVTIRPITLYHHDSSLFPSDGSITKRTYPSLINESLGVMSFRFDLQSMNFDLIYRVFTGLNLSGNTIFTVTSRNEYGSSRKELEMIDGDRWNSPDVVIYGHFLKVGNYEEYFGQNAEEQYVMIKVRKNNQSLSIGPLCTPGTEFLHAYNFETVDTSVNIGNPLYDSVSIDVWQEDDRFVSLITYDSSLNVTHVYGGVDDVNGYYNIVDYIDGSLYHKEAV